MSRENPYKVHIDLTGAGNFQPKETLIHRQLLCKMTATIMNDVNISIRNIEYNLMHNRDKWKEAQNLNYLVTGVRGSGKSTFLKYLIQCLTRELDILETGQDEKHRYSSKCYIGEELRQWPKCKLLCQYDPSAPASSKEASFFLTVIAAIKTMVEAQQRENYAKTPSRDYEFDTIKSKLKKMDKGLSRLSRGEPSMSNMTEYQASKLRLDNDDQDIKLRELLDEVLEILCRICDVKAFIITIDDADTRSRQCADVMESLRLYVSHPRLIVILAGDKKLYTERIRELHFDEYQLKYHTHDDSGHHSRMMSISAHANQYILKLFPSAHQYELRDLNTVLSKSDPISLIIHHTKSGENGVEIKELLREVFAATISQNPLRISIFIDQFLSLPLRSILEAMNYWTAHTVWDFLDQLRIKRESYNKIENNYQNTQQGTPLPEEKQSTHNNIHNINRKINWLERKIAWMVQVSLMHILQDEIRTYDSIHETLNVDTPRVYYSVLLRHCQNMDDLEHGFYLSGDMGMQREDKYITLLLAVSFKNLIKNLDGFISYIFFGPASVSLYAKAVEQLRREMEGKTPPEVEEMSRKFDSYLHVGSWDSPTRWARHANMIWCFDAGMEGIHSGILRLRDTGIVGELHDWVRQKFNDLTSKTNYESKKEALSILVSLSRSADRDNSFFISIFSYLAFILKCTHICDKYDRMKNNDKDSKQTELVRTMKEYFLIKSCRSPEWLMRDKVVKTYNTCPQKMQEILEALEKENQQDIAKFFNDVAGEIVSWHAKNNDPENNMEDDSEAYTSKNYKHRPEDIYCNNMTPHAMGKFWSDLFYLMKSSSYEAEGFRFENYETNPRGVEKRLMFSQVQLYLEGKYDHIEQFMNLTNKIFNSTFINTPDKLVGYYLERIAKFPLTEHFIGASESFFHYVSEKQDGTNITRNADIPLKVFQEAQEQTIKNAIDQIMSGLPTKTNPDPAKLAEETNQIISAINEFQKKLKQHSSDESNQKKQRTSNKGNQQNS